ncbi:MAG TPA: Yip1 family protein [Selenomonadales bacterium]|nr:Yip1 family protein [Selenomonadales bacterium]
MEKEQDKQGREEVNQTGASSDKEPEDIQLWRDMFFRPRAACRWLIRHETSGSATMMWLALTALLIVMMFLSIMVGSAKGDASAAKMRLVLITPILFLLSGVFYVVESHLLWLGLRLFGGKARPEDVRIVYSFTQVIPTAVFIIISLLLSLLIPRDSLLSSVVANIIMGWSLYITLAGLAEAGGIGAWRSLAVYFASLAVWGVLLLALAALTGVKPPGITKFSRLM